MGENFEAGYLKEIEIQREMEKIEMAYAKIVDKYGAYEECAGFIQYIKTLEKVFTEAKFRSWNAEKSKEELIKLKIDMLSGESHLDQGIFQSIYDDFKATSIAIGQVEDAVKTLLEKYKSMDCYDECCEFIYYLEYVLVNFQNNVEMENIKSGLIRARMSVISCDGRPELKILESIYSDFTDMIRQNK